MDGAMMLVLLTPLLIPIIDAYGIDPVHFGVVFMLNLEIGADYAPGWHRHVHRDLDRRRLD